MQQLAAQQREAKVDLEIIIVDNGCTLSTNVKTDIQKLSAPTKIIDEPFVGLSVARNAGVKVANGHILAFLDDDISISPTWIQGVSEIFSNKQVLCAGGAVICKPNGAGRPKWYSTFFSRFIVPPKFPRKRSCIEKPYYLIGANMAFRKKVFGQFGLFALNLGRRGRRLLSGEDIEMILRLRPESVWFEPKMQTYTSVNPNGVNRLYFIKRCFWQGVSDYIILKRCKVDRLYDGDEIILGIPLIRTVFRKLSERKFFEICCMSIRLFGLGIGKLYVDHQGEQSSSTPPG